MADIQPKFSFYVPGAPVYSQPLCLPASVIEGAKVLRAMISDGCILRNVTIERCVLGIRSLVGDGSVLRNVVMMGADLYESTRDPRPDGVPHIGVGRNCSIEGAIIDKNARIGDDVVITPKSPSDSADGDGYYIRDGIVVVPKNSVIPAGARI
jgi:glucose-1-phosphate adenylyltransferase